MKLHTRAARLALSAVCIGGGLVGTATALWSGTAAANGARSCPAEITGSGSSLQKIAQESVFTAHFTSTLCSGPLTVKYTKTSSGPALEEFGNATGALIASKSGNGTTLDGYVGSDDPPQPVQVNTADAAAGGGDQAELTIPVAEAPVALLLHPPSGCTVQSTPDILNTVLDELWQDKYASWDAFLTAANVTHSGTCTMAPTLVVRKDNSGTSYVFKSYLKQLDSAVWSGYANDFTTWPDATITPESTGGGAEVSKVASTEGAVGYAAASDAHAGGVAPWANAATLFWGDIQNNGSGSSGATYADPANAANGNCPNGVTPAGTPTAPGNWDGVLASNPDIAAASGFVAGQYSLCGLTYDLAWKDYGKIGGLGGGYYGGSSSAATEFGNATADFLTYVTGPGQSALASADQYYSALPTAVQKVAQETASEIGNPGGGGNNGGGGGQTTTTTTTSTTPATTTTTTTTSASTSTTASVTPPNVTATAASVVQGNHVSVTVSCPTGATTCAGSVSVKTASAIAASAASRKKTSKGKIAPFVVGKQSFTLQGGQSKTITVSLNSKAAALLRKHGSLPVIATVTVAGGHTVTEHVVLKLKKAKKAKKH
jgi:hypothetical protein